MKELIKNIENWAEERNLIQGSTPQKQFIKLMEEFGELCAGVSKNNIDMIKDSIGDCFIVLIIMNKQADNALLQINIADAIEQDNLTNEELFADVESKIKDKSKDGLVANLLIELTGSFGELGFSVLSEDYEDFSLLLPYLCLLGAFYRLSIEECVRAAWDEIKDRKGRMINGVFVKEADL
ncbi:pyrophosphatase [Aggregatibacter actinomycetemcomitans]|uniref:MazG-like family protein n=1 Tax=Aggregatibacter actinomycetemcomitans TaxID=714 RepID=UPI00197C1781|nr:MazG-like family protein [Aggregatibacter actinomycetemcomitans]MBN6068770.1 pyrophosphatase [Aggregatibacter actinomycetemcomitans]MBN6086725.1 pyrophosphatase [Aggregatibacter actinomycetemcomitans]